MNQEKTTNEISGGNTAEMVYDLWLYSAPGIGDRTMQKVLNVCGCVSEFYGGGRNLWQKLLTERQVEELVNYSRKVEPQGVYEELRKKQISFVRRVDPAYPERLKTIPDAPYALFVKGHLPENHIFSVAVVGARDCSAYGRYVAAELGRTLGEMGVQVISGMARGIDGVSQRAALEAGGKSFGVLGSGVDVCYPKGNRELYDKLCGQGGILSTYPLGTEARPQNFPPRNRIVSGLADVLVVIEARNKSGTLITVDMALEQGREVFAVPGRVTDRLSDGCNQLIRQGAGVFISPEIFLEEVQSLCGGRWNIIHGKTESGTEGGDTEDRNLEPELQEVFRVLDFQPQTLETIRKKLGGNYPASRLPVLLMRLCMADLAVQLTPGNFMRKV